SIINFFEGDYPFSLNMRMFYWGKSFPYIKKSKEYKIFNSSSELYRNIIVSIFDVLL
ncbi:unnamed protein product, partial [marine sediment metagenome]